MAYLLASVSMVVVFFTAARRATGLRAMGRPRDRDAVVWVAIISVGGRGVEGWRADYNWGGGGRGEVDSTGEKLTSQNLLLFPPLLPISEATFQVGRSVRAASYPPSSVKLRSPGWSARLKAGPPLAASSSRGGNGLPCFRNAASPRDGRPAPDGALRHRAFCLPASPGPRPCMAWHAHHLRGAGPHPPG